MSPSRTAALAARICFATAAAMLAACSLFQPAPTPATKPASRPAPVTVQVYMAERPTRLGTNDLRLVSDGRLTERAGPFTYEGTWRALGNDVIEGTFMEPKFELKEGHLVRTGETPTRRYYQLDPVGRTYRWSDSLEALRGATTAP